MAILGEGGGLVQARITTKDRWFKAGNIRADRSGKGGGASATSIYLPRRWLSTTGRGGIGTPPTSFRPRRHPRARDDSSVRATRWLER